MGIFDDIFISKTEYDRRRDKRTLDLQASNRKAILAEGAGAREQAQQDRKGAALALIQSNATASQAVGMNPRSEESLGLIGGLSSADPQAQQMAGQAVTNLEQQQADMIARAQQNIVNEAALLAAQNAQANTMRGDLRQMAEPVRELIIAADDVVNLLDTGSALGSRAALTKLAKALDPTTGVRGQETQNIASGLGAKTFLETEFRRLGGEGMDADAVAEFQGVVNALVSSRAKYALGMFEGFRVDAKLGGLPEGRIDAILQQSGVPLNELTQRMLKGMSREELAQRAEEYDRNNGN